MPEMASRTKVCPETVHVGSFTHPVECRLAGLLLTGEARLGASAVTAAWQCVLDGMAVFHGPVHGLAAVGRLAVILPEQFLKPGCPGFVRLALHGVGLSAQGRLGNDSSSSKTSTRAF